MKSCISTYSFERLYQDGGFTRFDAIDKTKEYGCQGVELVLDDKTPDGSTPMEYAKALCAHAVSYTHLTLPRAIRGSKATKRSSKQWHR